MTIARPVTMIQCPACKEQHPALCRLGGHVVVSCDKVKGNALRFYGDRAALVVGAEK